MGLGRNLWAVFKKGHSLGGDLLSHFFHKARVMDALPFTNLRKLLSHRPRCCFSSE